MGSEPWAAPNHNIIKDFQDSIVRMKDMPCHNPPSWVDMLSRQGVFVPRDQFKYLRMMSTTVFDVHGCMWTTGISSDRSIRIVSDQYQSNLLDRADEDGLSPDAGKMVPIEDSACSREPAENERFGPGIG